jgi:hypothetical protein
MITPRAIPASAPVERPKGKVEELEGVSEELAAVPKPLELDPAEVIDGAIDDMLCKGVQRTHANLERPSRSTEPLIKIENRDHNIPDQLGDSKHAYSVAKHDSPCITLVWIECLQTTFNNPLVRDNKHMTPAENPTTSYPEILKASKPRGSHYKGSAGRQRYMQLDIRALDQ